MEDIPDSLLNIINNKKEYFLDYMNDKYRLLIERDSKKIFFKLDKSNEISLFYYRNNFTLEKIVNQLELDSKKYDTFEKLFKLIDENYKYNNIIIIINDNTVDLLIGKTSISLIKTDVDINEMFSNVLNEIIDIKKNGVDELVAIELFLNDIKNDTDIKLNEENEKINSLQNDISKDLNETNKIKEEINELKEKINNFKKQKENLIKQ